MIDILDNLDNIMIILLIIGFFLIDFFVNMFLLDKM